MPTSSSATPGHSRMRALQVLALHHFLHRQRRQNVQRHAGVVTFAVARRAFDHRLVPAHARLLRRLRDVVDIATQRDHRLARSPTRHPGRGNSGDAALDLEAFLLEHAGEVFGGFEFLETQFAEAEDAIHHDLRLFLHGVDLAGEVGLHGSFFLGRNLRLGDQCNGAPKQDEQCFPHWHSVPDPATRLLCANRDRQGAI